MCAGGPAGFSLALALQSCAPHLSVKVPGRGCTSFDRNINIHWHCIVNCAILSTLSCPLHLSGVRKSKGNGSFWSRWKGALLCLWFTCVWSHDVVSSTTCFVWCIIVYCPLKTDCFYSCHPLRKWPECAGSHFLGRSVVLAIYSTIVAVLYLLRRSAVVLIIMWVWGPVVQVVCRRTCKSLLNLLNLLFLLNLQKSLCPATRAGLENMLAVGTEGWVLRLRLVSRFKDLCT